MNGNLRFYYKARGMFVSNSAILAKASVKLEHFTYGLADLAEPPETISRCHTLNVY